MLQLEHISKSYGVVAALHDVSLHVKAGEIVCLLGPSGCGKSTLLRLVAGLEQADSGSICFDGTSIDTVPTHQRGFGLMFQDYALFPHMSVGNNIAFGLQHEPSREARRRRVDELLKLVGLAGYGERRVDALSGGERQRVALARSLAPNPRLLMLDEPLGALDRALRERLLDELRVILKRVGVMSLYITHDQAEAFAIADRLVLMNAGKIEQHGDPEEVYRHPTTRFAAQFLGFTNLVEGKTIDITESSAIVETSLGRLRVEQTGARPGDQVIVVIRPEAAQPADIQTANSFRGTVVERSFRGSRTRVAIKPGYGAVLEFELDAPVLAQIGEQITLALRPDSMSLIPN